jgi:hypothetical protein
MMNKKILIGVLLAPLAMPIYAENIVTSTTTTATSSNAQASNQASPYQSINSYGQRQAAPAPELAVGGSIGTHLCETAGGVSGGWLTGDAGVIIPVSKQYCVYLNVSDFLQQSATMEEKAGNKTMAENLRYASYDLVSQIDATIKGVLSRDNVLKPEQAVQSDKSGTVGLQPSNYVVK